MSHDGFWDNPTLASQTNQELNNLKLKIKPWEKIGITLDDSQVLLDMAKESGDDSLEKELEQEIILLEKEYEKIEIVSLLSDELDPLNCFIYIHPGAGGTESCDWANMLLRMYQRWAERSGFEIDIIDLLPGDEAGIKSATLEIKGEYAFGYLKSENGIHRLVRISPFDSNKRRHTSFASVFVYPEIDDSIDVDIKEVDLKVDVYRASGAGGQHVNKTESAVRITHLPTGIVVTCQNERSQHKNRATAMKILRARLYEKYRQEKQDEIEKLNPEKKDISWGNQIRSYVFQPYCLIKDHRTGVEVGNVQAVMDGDIDDFLEGYLKKYVNKNKGNNE